MILFWRARYNSVGTHSDLSHGVLPMSMGARRIFFQGRANAESKPEGPRSEARRALERGPKSREGAGFLGRGCELAPPDQLGGLEERCKSCPARSGTEPRRK